MAAGKVKVEMLADSWVTKRGEVVEVSKDIAEHLIANKLALGISAAAKKLEAEIEGTAPPAPAPQK